MAIVFADRVRFATVTTGTGTVTVGAAAVGFRTPAAASIPTGSTVGYVIEDGAAWEVGFGTYTTAGTTMSRDTVTGSSLGGTTKLTLTGAAVVFLTVIASQAAGFLTNAAMTTPPPIGATTPNTGAFSQLTATGGSFETRVAVAASAIDLNTASFFTKTIAANTTFTIANTPAAGRVASFILELTNGGAFTVTWWAGVKWAGGVVPTLTVSGVDILGFYTTDGGTTWRGMMLARDSQ